MIIITQIKKFISSVSGLQWQSTYLVITCVIIGFLSYVRINELVIADPKPVVLPLLPKKQAGIAGIVAPVETGLFLKNFSVFDTVNNQFVIDATVWFLFNPIDVGLETIGKFSFLKGKILKKSEPDSRLVGKKMLVRYDITVEFSTNLDQRFFPFDDHLIALILINEFVSTDELIYKSEESGFTVASDLYTGGYAFADKSVESGYMISKVKKNKGKFDITNPTVVYMMDFFKPGIRRALLILLPIIIIYLISVFGFYLTKLGDQRRITFGAFTALLAYRFVIETLSPKVGYFTLTDYVYFFSLTVVFIVFLFSVYYSQKQNLSPIEDIMRNVVTFLAYPSLIIFIYYVFFFWGR